MLVVGFMVRLCPCLSYPLQCRPSLIFQMNRSHSANLFFLSFFLEVIFPYAAVDLVYPWDEFCFLEQHEELDPPWEEGLLEFNVSILDLRNYKIFSMYHISVPRFI